MVGITRTNRRPTRLYAAAAIAVALAATFLLVTPKAAEVPWAKPAAKKPAAPPVENEWAGINFKIDKDEWRDTPRRHRYVHGCFTPSHLCMSLYMPPREFYRGRFVAHMEGGAGGLDKMMTQPGWDWAFNNAFDDLGAYLVETNEGHWPDEGTGLANPRELWLANAHGVRYSRTMAAEMYGQPPARGYITGCSGGGLRSQLGLENAPDLYDGAVPQSGHGGATSLAWSAYSRMGIVLAKEGVAKVIDAADVGGSGEIFEGLDTLQREALSDFLRLGWPRDAIHQLRQYWPGTGFVMALYTQSNPYYTDFWTQKGFEGHDYPELLKPFVIDTEVTVERVMTVRELRAQGPGAAGVGGGRNPDTATYGPATDGGDVLDSKPAAYLNYPHTGKLFLSRATILTGADAGKTMYFSAVSDNGLVQAFLPLSPWGFNNVKAGDKIRIDNRDYLAYSYLYRHAGESAVNRDPPELRTADNRFLPELRSLLTTWGRPIFAQVPATSAANATDTGRRQRGGVIEPHQKMIYLSGTADAAMWPAYVNTHVKTMRDKLAAEADGRFRIWWMEGVPHCSGPMTGPASTMQVNVQGFVAHALIDTMRWAEQGSPAPGNTTYRMDDNSIVLGRTAAERQGIQPVVQLKVNGSVRAEVTRGTPVALTAHAEVPPGTGSLTRAEWDFDGQGTWPVRASPVSGQAGTYSTTYTYDKPGTYFPAVRVASRRDGLSVNAAPVYNISRARVVVR